MLKKFNFGHKHVCQEKLKVVVWFFFFFWNGETSQNGETDVSVQTSTLNRIHVIINKGKDNA